MRRSNNSDSATHFIKMRTAQRQSALIAAQPPARSTRPGSAAYPHARTRQEGEQCPTDRRSGGRASRGRNTHAHIPIGGATPPRGSTARTAERKRNRHDCVWSRGAEGLSGTALSVYRPAYTHSIIYFDDKPTRLAENSRIAHLEFFPASTPGLEDSHPVRSGVGAPTNRANTAVALRAWQLRSPPVVTLQQWAPLQQLLRSAPGVLALQQ